MTEYRQVSEAEAERLRETAQLVMSTLIRFGFRATTPLENAGLGGAEVEVDTADDSEGGVHIRWSIPNSLNNEVVSHVLGGGGGSGSSFVGAGECDWRPHVPGDHDCPHRRWIRCPAF